MFLATVALIAAVVVRLMDRRGDGEPRRVQRLEERVARLDRKSTRLNSSHLVISHAVFCLKKKHNRRWCGDIKIHRRRHIGDGSGCSRLNLRVRGFNIRGWHIHSTDSYSRESDLGERNRLR